MNNWNFHSPQDKDPAASSSSRTREQSRPPVDTSVGDLTIILREAEQRSLERDVKNQEELDTLQELVLKFARDAQTNDQIEIDDDQCEEGEEEEQEFEPDYTEE